MGRSGRRDGRGSGFCSGHGRGDGLSGISGYALGWREVLRGEGGQAGTVWGRSRYNTGTTHLWTMISCLILSDWITVYVFSFLMTSQLVFRRDSSLYLSMSGPS